ncbi:MAG: bifunctional diguanylate cyclase/phosphodiesterase [Pseudomonadota bacterium]
MNSPKGMGKGALRLAPWLAGGLLALVATGLAMRHAARVQLEADAQHAALHWAAFARDSVPDLDRALAGGGFTPEALAQLNRLRQAGEVFRFKLFDAAGRNLLVSDDLQPAGQAAPPASTPAPATAPNAHDDASLREVLRSGRPQVALRRETRADRPPVYSEAYVAVQRAGRVLGAVEVYVDQTARAQRIDAAFRKVALAVTLALTALGAFGAWHWGRRARREREAEERMRYLAQHDVLTGTLNRARFREALERAEARAREGGAGFAVLSIDIHGFKDVNDTLGHAAGDELLRAVALRLRDTVRELDLVARLGGDEFAVLQAGVAAPEEVSRLGQRIVDALGLPYEIAGQPLHAAASVGAALYGHDGSGHDELLHKADQALRRAKASRRASFSFYDAVLDEKLQGRRAIVRDLRHALYAGELHLHFQPLYERDGATLGGYEALVRWHHPQRGPVSPAEFIPLAEESGLIEDLGTWVLARACEVAATWPPSLSLSVNLSAAQFRRGDELVGVVGACLEAAGLPAHRLELEITESLLMGNTEAVVQTLHRLTATGVRIVMDDFGTGYSSLAYLWRFPFDKVKIDRAFTQHLGQDPKVDLIVRSIVSLAHSLNIRVNAEGVETPAQMRCLQDHGCDELQGFLLGRPSPAAQLRHEGAPEEASAPRLPRAATDFAPLPPSTLPTPWAVTKPQRV